ncbi:AAA family ATPase, partial [Mesotoga prima]
MVDLQPFFEIQERLFSSVPTEFKRYAYELIDWNDPLLGIVGARGCGKTTMLLQKILEKGQKGFLYISGDNPLVLREGIYA